MLALIRFRHLIAVLLLTGAQSWNVHGAESSTTLEPQRPTDTAPPALAVRRATEAELKDLELVSSDEAMGMAVGGPVITGGGFGAAALPLGAAYATYLVVVLPATLLFADKLDSWRRNALASAIREVDIAGITETELRRRHHFQATTSPGQQDGLEILIGSYGFEQGSPHHICVFLHAHMRATARGESVFNDTIHIANHNGSPDAPPPYCTQAKRFGENQGVLAKQALTETAEILAGIVAARISSRPPWR